MPAVIKTLFVPFEIDIFNIPELRERAMPSIKHYFSRMPFASDAIEEKGPRKRYWDVYPTVVPIPPECWDSGRVEVKCRGLINATADAKHIYNSKADIPADIAVGIISSVPTHWIAGFSSGSINVCSTEFYGACTHEIGHSLINVFDVAIHEASDSYASKYTCGYHYRKNDYIYDCQDWAWDPETGEVYDPSNPPINVMCWSGFQHEEFFTRYFYEGACHYLGGSCNSILYGEFSLKPLGVELYLDGARDTDEVYLVKIEDTKPPLWRAEIVPLNLGGNTVVKLYATGALCSGCPFVMLIGNKVTGEIKTVPPDYYYHPSDPMNRSDWCASWEVTQLASGIIMLEGYWCDSNLKWDDKERIVGLHSPEELRAEYWTPTFHWRVVKPKPYSGYPDD